MGERYRNDDDPRDEIERGKLPCQRADNVTCAENRNRRHADIL